MKKQLWTLASLVLAAALVLSACQPKPTPTEAPKPTAVTKPTEAPRPTETPKPTTITIWHQWEGKYLDTIAQAFKDYEAAHPGVIIDLTKPDNVSDALKVAIPAGEGPDIIGWANDQIGAQALAGNIVDLGTLGIDMKYLESNFEPAAVKGVIWQGKIWALPESQEGIAIVYNKALAKAEDFPSDPLNFEDLLAKAKAFAEKNPGKFLICNQGLGGSDPYHVAPVYFGFGVPSYVDDQGKAYLGTPEALAAGKWMVEYKKYAPAETSHEICKTMLVEGKAAAWWTGPWAIADIEAAKIDYGILPMGRPFVGIKTLMISKNAVDRGTAQVALDIIKYFTSAEVQKKLTLANKTIPANTAALKDPEVQALVTVAGFGASLNLGVPMANTPYAMAQWGPVGDATMAIWTGSQTPEEALAAAQKTIEEKIAEMK